MLYNLFHVCMCAYNATIAAVPELLARYYLYGVCVGLFCLLWLQVCEEVFADLERFGDRVSGEIDTLGRQAELEPPYIRSL